MKLPTKMESRRQTPLFLVERVVTPVDCIPERLLPLRQIERSARQQRQPLLQSRQPRPRREQPDAGRRKLYRQRQPVQPVTDSGQGLRTLPGEPEVRLDGLRPRHEEGDGRRF